MNYPDFFSQLSHRIDPNQDKLEFHSLSNLDYQNFPSKIIVSIVNFEEDKIGRNQVSFPRYEDSPRHHPASQNKTLYCLFASHSLNSGDYLQGIQNLAEIHDRIMDNPIFQTEGGSNRDLQFRMEWISLNWEQQFYLWNSLGVKQLPYFLYKIGIRYDVQNPK